MGHSHVSANVAQSHAFNAIRRRKSNANARDDDSDGDRDQRGDTPNEDYLDSPRGVRMEQERGCQTTDCAADTCPRPDMEHGSG